VIGKGHRGALVTLVERNERKSLYTVIRSVLHKTAEAVRNAVVDGLTVNSLLTIQKGSAKTFGHGDPIVIGYFRSVQINHTIFEINIRPYQRVIAWNRRGLSILRHSM